MANYKSAVEGFWIQQCLWRFWAARGCCHLCLLFNNSNLIQFHTVSSHKYRPYKLQIFSELSLFVRTCARGNPARKGDDRIDFSAALQESDWRNFAGARRSDKGSYMQSRRECEGYCQRCLAEAQLFALLENHEVGKLKMLGSAITSVCQFVLKISLCSRFTIVHEGRNQTAWFWPSRRGGP